MNADEFSEHLALLAPPASELVTQFGMSDVEARRFQAAYSCSRVSAPNGTDPLLDLCVNFDVSSIEISEITLCKPRDFDSSHWTVGHAEADTVIYEKLTGLITLRDHAALKREICKVAATSEGFLAAMLVVAEFNTQCLFDPKLRLESASAPEALRRCLRLAGNETRPFYTVLLGIE